MHVKLTRDFHTFEYIGFIFRKARQRSMMVAGKAWKGKKLFCFFYFCAILDPIYT